MKVSLTLKKIVRIAPYMLFDNIYPVRPIWWLVVLFFFSTLLLIPVRSAFVFVLYIWTGLACVRVFFLIAKIIGNASYHARYVRKSLADEGGITVTTLSDPPLRR